eukprot:CAMPEP_0206126776 /NCGR_PEP_ID=MMETSP1472-20131121/23865_1 /ASSEMBLY_ACC=CAM_ASM_001108 /TAXON_ID=41880 /ORGANISM="Pycnococcus provasolii, Strain RCC251" /LENGTH=73 /DNA_ID=CAMNT_0053517819 /DNA_START=156 /DNA_END=376 /DNA_ORIENTATION=-
MAAALTKPALGEAACDSSSTALFLPSLSDCRQMAQTESSSFSFGVMHGIDAIAASDRRVGDDPGVAAVGKVSA